MSVRRSPQDRHDRTSSHFDLLIMRIVTPSTPAQLDQVRGLFREFVAWHRERHCQDLHLIDRYFDDSAFEAELAALPGDYFPPSGELLLALVDSEPAGCVALRRIDPDACEMKRMFLRTAHHGKGIGRALALGIIDAARRLGYRRMLLDTSVRQREAIALYRRVGFTEVSPYYDLPIELREWLVFMELVL